MIFESVIADIVCEHTRQLDLWSVQDHDPFHWLSILGEEVGEACQAANKAHWNHASWANYRHELVQVAAVACAAVECLDRHEGRP